MRDLNDTLRENDRALLDVLAEVWGVTSETYLEQAELIDLLGTAMLDPERSERVWGRLNDDERGALQTLIGSGGQMPKPMFERLFGEIRKMGAGQMEREKPHQNPETVAEALFYRGLTGETFQLTDAGPRIVVYVPTDLLPTLPTHKTAYENIDAEVEDEPIGVEALTEVGDVQPADTALVDDMTTLLAYLQLYTPLLQGESLAQADQTALASHLLKPFEQQLTFMLGLGLSAGLIEIQSGRAYPRRAEVRRWLSASRHEQVRQLAETWRDSGVYRDLWQVPGLHPDPGGSLDSYDPAVARHALTEFIANLTPVQEWWSLESLIEAVRASDPDFQRPDGNYDDWYIRNDAGEYLTGFESWDAVEGALLEFMVLGPMHWLGLVDLADDAAKMTAYGRAFVDVDPWPQVADQPEKITLQEDGKLLISRRASRIDRFQAARFTTWVSAGDPYTYKIDAAGLERGAQQSINAGHIAAFIDKATGAKIPQAVAKLLDNWKEGAKSSVSLERLMVLRTTSPATLTEILDNPALRRYLGARLGDMAVVVRADQWQDLRQALGEQGIQVEVSE